MTPKEKAKELYDKFDVYPLKIVWKKDCALICVDEIISACEHNYVESLNTDWWNKVKEEIELIEL